MTEQGMSHAFVVLPPRTKPLPKPDDAAYCAASGCHRWSRRWGPHGSFLCGFHWMRLTKRERATVRRIWRTMRLIGGPPYPRQLRAREWRVWRALVRRAGSP